MQKLKITFAWILALVSLLPVLFMVWLSILSADDINQSVFFPQFRNDKVTFFVEQRSNSTGIVGTSLGHVYEYSKEPAPNIKKITEIKSVATAYSQSDNTLWAFSANRGLVEINLRGGAERNAYNWAFFKKSYESFDPTGFYKSNDILPEHYEWLGKNLNNQPALPREYGGKADTTVSTLAKIRFFEREEIVDQLNWLLTNDVALNSVLNYWKKWDGWLNPQIHYLFKNKKLSSEEKRLLFRICLAELFPNKVSRLKRFEWQDIWVNQVAVSGLSVLAVNDKVIMGISGASFPGIAIFDTETKEISWLTEAKGLPSVSVQNIIQISEYEVLIEHDMGFSIAQFVGAGKITHNFMFGEYGLPYLDDQRLYIKAYNENKIYVSNENASFLFDFRNFETLPSNESVDIVLQPDMSSYFENEKGDMWVGYTDGRLEILDSENNLIMDGLTVPKGKRTLQWSNYQDLMKIMPLTTFLKNSVLISLSISLLCTLLAVFPSYAIARLKFRGRSTFLKIMLFSNVLSSLPFLIPIFVVFILLQMKLFQMFNNFAVIVLVNMAFFLPLAVQFLTNVFRAIPQNLEESAKMDGCSPLTTFIKVILPAVFPSLGACLVYIFILAWDELLFIWILSVDSSTATLPMGIRLTVGQLANRPELLMTFSVIAAAPPIILFALLRNLLFKNILGNK
ncbi:MAG: carbohydrate ABC transporter permease [Fibromonadaceae bacterium]|jgi:ABC-type glycerol-3-phosphate transport system permease component|nr:carbohydrate ABC transporter permease [Fibromonadaceae bacterium]